uniref:Signal peptidase complex subunit 2 n=1 Tax=Blastobotrys adeninivorans TaxID=409370 RepID=A0A060TAU2_BLAAD
MSLQTKAVNLYSSSDLKTTSDDHVASVVQKLGYKPDYSHEYLRLTLGYLAVAAAGATFYMDYYVGFVQMQTYIAIAVAVYGVLTFAYNVLLWYVERGLVVKAKKGDDILTIRTNTPKATPVYKVTIGSSKGTHTVEGQFNDWFDPYGFIVYPKFEAFLTEAISKKQK